MKIIKRLIAILILLPVAIVLVSLAVANRGVITLALDPFSPQEPALAVQVPLFVVIFGALLAGILIGGFMAWLKQGRHRKAARDKGYEARKWRMEADRQQQRVERMSEQAGIEAPALPAPGNKDSARSAA